MPRRTRRQATTGSEGLRCPPRRCGESGWQGTVAVTSTRDGVRPARAMLHAAPRPGRASAAASYACAVQMAQHAGVLVLPAVSMRFDIADALSSPGRSPARPLAYTRAADHDERHMCSGGSCSFCGSREQVLRTRQSRLKPLLRDHMIRSKNGCYVPAQASCRCAESRGHGAAHAAPAATMLALPFDRGNAHVRVVDRHSADPH